MQNSKLKEAPGIYVAPSLKLAFCPFAKVATTDMALLFNEVNGLAPARDLGACEVFPRLPTLHMSPANISKENGWKFAYIARDPLERYLSAFLSKCGPNGGGVIPQGGACCHGPVMPLSATLQEKISLFEKRVMLDSARGSPVDDLHWKRQSDILAHECARDGFRADAVDFKGEITKHTTSTHEQVKALLELAGAPNVDRLVDRYFPIATIAGHHNEEVNPADFYRNFTVTAAALSLYKEDYAKLGLPLPDYVSKQLAGVAASYALREHV